MDKFYQLTAFLDSLREDFAIPGCACTVAKDGVVVYLHTAGYADAHGQRPVSPEDTYWLYSATKLFTCTQALRLAERGLLCLDDPVSLYLPEYASLTVREADGRIRPARTRLLVRHLLTMTGGLDYRTERPAIRALLRQNPNASTRALAAAMAADPLCFDPGSHFLYSLCHDVLGAVLEVASGLDLETLLQEEIIRPLGMTDTTFFPNQARLARLSAQYVHNQTCTACRQIPPANRFRLSPAYASGGAGLLGTVTDYIRLPAALSMGGLAENGYRLLRPESVALMRTPCLNSVQQRDFLNRSASARGYSYGLGVRVLTDSAGTPAPLGEFGWDGAAGAYAMISPAQHLALYYAQHVCQSPSTYLAIHPKLRDIVCSVF